MAQKKAPVNKTSAQKATGTKTPAKSAATQSTDVRQKAKDLREQQRKSEIRTRNIIIGVVGLLVAAIVVAIIFIIVNRPDAGDAAAGLPEEFQEGAPIVVTAEGVSAGALEPTENQLSLYFDYTCGGCVSTETMIGQDLFDEANSGTFEYALHPVMTANGAFNTAATAAALQVVANDPEHFEALHEAMIALSYQALVDKDYSVVGSLPASEEAVAELAAQVGVPQEVIDGFDSAAAQQYLTISSEAWGAREVEGRTKVASPEFVYNNVQIVPQGQDAPEVIASMMTQIEQAKG